MPKIHLGVGPMRAISFERYRDNPVRRTPTECGRWVKSEHVIYLNPITNAARITCSQCRRAFAEGA